MLRHVTWRARASATAGVLVALGLGGLPSLAQGDPDPAGITGYRELTLDAGDYTFGWPDIIEAGRTAITMENGGQDVHHAQLVKLKEGVTPEDVLDALPHLEDDPAQLFSRVSFHGGPSIVAPGASQRLILDLEPGTYVWLCGLPAADGEPHFAKGMITSFEVVAADAPMAASPGADGRLALQDFAFGLPDSIAAGPQLWEVVNEGEQPHEFIIAKLAPGTTAMDFAMAAFDPEASGPPPGLPYGGLQVVEPGATAWLELDLEPGTYGAVCFVPDPGSGEAHVALGMVTEFAVEA